MALTVVEAQVDAELKRNAERILAEAGLTVSEAMRMFLNKIVAEEHVSLDLFHPNAETLEAMRELHEGNLSKFATVEELMADLNADD